ncbi:RraA family protein [Rhodocytophaga aerolata]|uniref:RraA family protein n=1 Tax=Rhodocytophaga aerolata TaxID=455078 RepID=A0ABT8QZ71_9BACT|nr:RraA family protein [Rhodocytophaga aerolata]MDO1444701.1 RraA family protein [Rhodocytophaga aerolata]
MNHPLMKQLSFFSTVFLFLLFSTSLRAQSVALPKESITGFTAQWKGERFPDGRPKVPDNILERMKDVSLENAWSVVRGAGYNNQFAGDWQMIHPDQVMVGRALTAQYMPKRPDVEDKLIANGKKEGRIGGTNSWPIDMLSTGDIYVADAYGKIADGTLIGDNLGNSIYAKSKNGVVFDGAVRDLEGLSKIEGFNAFVRGFHPSFIAETMLTGVNVPIQIGPATVLPGDIVLAKKGGILFVPAHLAETVVQTSEVITLRDEFGHMRLKEGKYTPGQIDTRWSKEIEADFAKWLDANPGKLKMTRAQMDELLKTRTW